MALEDIRRNIRRLHRAGERAVIKQLCDTAMPTADVRHRAYARAVELVGQIRSESKLSLMEVFMAEYGLSTEEGVALMCLAEALLRVPDTDTIDALIEDKLAHADWSAHLGSADSSLVNASTFALLLAGKVLDPEPPAGVLATLGGAVRRLGEPVIRAATKQAMKLLGEQFVLGRTIEEAVEQGARRETKGFSFSYDMLGEAAMTAADAAAYFDAYAGAIAYLADHARGHDVRTNPGISIKLSALHPRYEFANKARILEELVPRVKVLAVAAKKAGMGLNIDAEEADRLDLSLDIIEAVLRDGTFAGWDGFGVVVQAYGKRAAAVIDWLYALATELDRRIMVRLVKGAYWDSEIKQAQVDGVEDFPVFTHKVATDVSYLCCANKLFGMSHRIYPQFATHNAHTVASILELAGEGQPFEFQRLHGMGESLLDTVTQQANCHCRIYAPVGAHRDLLAYLVRRLLENGANSSFVNQIVDASVPAEIVAADPFETVAAALDAPSPHVVPPARLFGDARTNARGWDLRNADDVAGFDAARAPFKGTRWHAAPMLAAGPIEGTLVPVTSPVDPTDVVGHVVEADAEQARLALEHAAPWTAPVAERAVVLRRAADLYESSHGELFALLTREAGKSPADAVAELREAVDFLRFYAAEGEAAPSAEPCGLFTCISPWNFPLAIFTGQIAAALAAGNGVLAKPAEATPLVAARAVRLLHDAGVPKTALQLLPGQGGITGAALTADPRVAGVCFTGSTATAQRINRTMAKHLAPTAPLIAETGGINAMIVDSTALAEQAVRDIVASAFQSAGQRCSALRVLYLQRDIADDLLEMLYGAMDELTIGDPWHHDTDVGPVIDAPAQEAIQAYIQEAETNGRLLKQLPAPSHGHFVGPAVIRVSGIEAVEREIFGPVLHVATFKAADLGKVIDSVNASGYGLTFGLHTRINDRVEQVRGAVQVGNLYVNRNQIGAVVGSQPFGGEGLSGTGPKAGGPHYFARFKKPEILVRTTPEGAALSVEQVQAVIDAMVKPPVESLDCTQMPGPTGELNELSLYPRGLFLCLGPSADDAARQADVARRQGCPALLVAPGAAGADALDGFLPREVLTQLQGIAAVVLWGGEAELGLARRALAQRDGPLLPLVAHAEFANVCHQERHVCIDTTAAGGNATLMAAGG